MTRKKDIEITPANAVAQIIRELETVTAGGHRPGHIFEDWIVTVRHCLEALPRHAEAAARTGRLAGDTPEAQAHWAHLNQRYKPHHLEAFSRALGVLLIASEEEWSDFLGQVYMQWGWPSTGHGQYFTPYELCRLMAQVTIQDPTEDLTRRLVNVWAGLPDLLGLYTSLGYAIDVDHPATVRELSIRHADRVMPLVDPIKVCDPAVGSGALLLAVAEMYPRWALTYGLVQFYGQDIDVTCVEMCKVNFMVRGLNQFDLRCWLALSGADLTALPIPEPQRSIVEVARAEVATDDRATLAELSAYTRQLSLFGAAATPDTAIAALVALADERRRAAA